MKLNHYRSFLGIIPVCIVLLLAAGSCRSSKKSAESTDSYTPAPGTTVRIPEKEPARTLEADFGRLAASYGEWSDLRVPVRLELKSPAKFSVSGRATLVRGKAVHISVRILGMEMGSLYADNDSVFIAVKLNKILYAESMGKFSRTFGLTMTDLQDALLGRAFYPGKGTVEASSAPLFKFAPVETVEKNPDGSFVWDLTPRKSHKGVDWFYKILSPSADELAAGVVPFAESLTIVPSASAKGSCLYSDPILSPCGIFASVARVQATAGKRTIDASLRWSLDDAQWNTGASANYTKPRGYRRVSTSEVLKMLKGLSPN